LKLVDTTFIIGLLRGDPATVEKARQLDLEGGAASTAVNVFEVAYGVHRSMSDSERRRDQAHKVISNLEIFPLDSQAAYKAAEIAAGLDKRGMTVDPFDALVAGIALSNGVKTIVTRNTDHFERIPEIEVEEH